MIDVVIRPEEAADREAVFAVNAAAFPTDAEARLIDRLRDAADPYRAWVAQADRAVVGHIVFTPVVAAPETGPPWAAFGLAPMAVAPAFQGQGIGSRLVRAGLEALDGDVPEGLGCAAVFVLGHAAFYPRFGFRPAIDRGWRFAPGTEHVFFVRGPASIPQGPGSVRYHHVFAELSRKSG